MDSTEVTLFFDQPKVSALQSILAEDGTTLTEKLREYFQFLYEQLVPAEQQTAIETQIRHQQEQERMNAEARKRFAVFHVQEDGEDFYFTSQHFTSFHSAGYRYRLFCRGESSSDPQKLAEAFIGADVISAEQYNFMQTQMASDPRILVALDFNVDEGTVTACEQGQNRGRCYSLHDVSVAAYKAFRGEYRTSAQRAEIFADALDGKEIDTQMIEDKNSGIQVKGAAMDREAFAAYLNSIRPDSDYAAKIWWQWAKELEEFDSSHGELPAGEYKTAEMFLNEFAEHLHTIREIHGDEIAGQMISLAEISACPFPWEMKLAAEHLAGGGKVEDIPEMEEAGTLEDFSEDLPPQEDGIQMPPM